MPLAPGSRFGPYEIVALLGRGGMGEVYRARDPKLGRHVAIKIIAESFLADPDRLARFEREARALAALSHPNVGAIYGFEQTGDVHGLVLELVEGPTLAEQMTEGRLSVLQALTIARQIADALDSAHEQGIVHRDLKPANIKIGPKNTVKVLDFGLAKMERDKADVDLAHSPTVASGATHAGVILGTAAYMSPEQARGRLLDKRTDVWSFGCVLYEMLAARQAFGADTLSDTIAAVLGREPDWASLDPATPDSIRRLLQRCLNKDQHQRLRDIGDARLELDHAVAELGAARPAETGGRRAVEPGRQSYRWLVPAAAVALLVAAIAGGALYVLRTETSQPAPLDPPLQLTMFNDSALAPALSPDGRMLTFIRGGRFGDSAPRGQIYVKILPTGEPVQLTRDQFTKEQPVFSPDGSRIIYTAVTQGFRWDSWQVPVLGGAPQPFMPNASGLAWLDNQNMLYSEIMTGVHMGVVTSNESRSNSRAIYFPQGEGAMAHRSARSPDGKELLLVEMDGSGWLPCRLMPFDGSNTGRRVGPQDGQCTTVAWSPDGRWMYFSSNAGGAYHIWRQRYPDGIPEPITSGPTEQEGTAITPDGKYLITSMGLQQAGIWMRDGDSERELTAEGYSLLPVMGASGQRVYYLTRTTNSLAYASGELSSVNLATGERQRMLPGYVMANYAISADEKRVVFASSGNKSGDGVWIADLDRRTPPKQLTQDGAFRVAFGAPGEIVYLSQGDVRYLYRMNEDGSALERVFPNPLTYLMAVSPDGQWAVALRPRPEGGTMSQFIPLRGGTPFDFCNVDCAIGFGPNRVQAPVANWSADASSVFVGLQYFGFRTARTVVLPYRSGVPLEKLWPKGLRTEMDVAANPGARVLNEINAFPATGSAYLSWRITTPSNLYQLPLPRP